MASTITGMMKVFYKNYLKAYSAGMTFTVSTGTSSASYAYDQDPTSRWISSGSSDIITETIEIVFQNALSINRIMALGMNWKNFTVKYDPDGSGYVDFAAVYSKKDDVSASSITYTTNTETSRYWEFTTVTALKVKFTINTTQTANAEKYVYELYIGKEIGTFTDDLTGNPNTFNPSFEDGAKYLEKSNMGQIVYERGKKMRAQVKLKNIWETVDKANIATMFSEREFGISLCGSDGSQYVDEPWRLQDFYNVIIKGKLSGKFSIGRDSAMGVDQDFELNET